MSLNSNNPLSNLVKGGFFAIFFSTGFSALIFQVIWQRVLTIHAGVDLYSVTTVVAAFMAGLGLGSLLGGYIADRLSTRNCFVLFIISNVVVGVFGIFSLWLFYDFYNGLVHYLQSTASSFLFHFVLLSIPTTFMGLSLPLLSRAMVRTSDEMSSLVGALYGINTLGAAVGAGFGTWYMLGTYGFVASVRIASLINILSGLTAIILLSGLKSSALSVQSGTEPKQNSDKINTPGEKGILANKPGGWILIYGLTGFAALSLEIVWFRLFDVITRSTSYVFGHVLFIYLIGLGLGSLISSRIINRIKRPDKFFLWLQYLIGLFGLLIPFILISFQESLQINRHMIGSLSLYPFRGIRHFFKYFLFFNVYASLIFGITTVFMGMCFPLVQRIVSRQMETLGRNLSKLLFSNIIGSILGSIITGFFLLDFFGTPATLKIIGSLLIIPGIIAGYGLKRHSLRFFSIVFISFLSLIVIISYPNEKEFWNFFLGTKTEDIVSIREDRTSVNALVKVHLEREFIKFYYGIDIEDKDVRKNRPGLDALIKSFSNSYELLTNGHSYISFIPVRGNASKLGIAPALYHPDPKTGLVIGLGSGNTLYSMSLDKRLEKIKSVELSGGQAELLKKESWRKDFWQVKNMLSDPRIEMIVGDGRKFLLHSEEKFDLIEMDPFPPYSAYMGNLYSIEFFELIKKHLKPGGIFCQFLGSSRVEKNILKIYPYVVRFSDLFVLASNEPIELNKSVILERLKSLNLMEAYTPDHGQSLTDYFTETLPAIIQAGKTTEYPDEDLNLDLFPRDEYFMNNIIDANFRAPMQ